MFTVVRFSRNKIARAWKGYIRGSNLGMVLYFSVRTPNIYQSSSRPSMSPEKGQMDAAFSTSWKRHASFVTVTTSASLSARIHKLVHNSPAPVRSVSWLIRGEIKISFTWRSPLLYCNVVMQFYRDVDIFCIHTVHTSVVVL